MFAVFDRNLLRLGEGGGGEIVFFFFLFLGLCVIRARWWAKDFALAVRIAVALREGVGFRRIGG